MARALFHTGLQVEALVVCILHIRRVAAAAKRSAFYLSACVYVACIYVAVSNPCLSPVRLCHAVSERGIACNNWTTETQSAAAEAEAAKEIANAREAVKYVYKEIYTHTHMYYVFV